MAKNFVQEGECITITASAQVASGDFVVQGNLGGVAVHDAESGDDLTICLEGVYELPKATGTAWTQGDLVYWDGSKFTKTASGNTKFGAAAADAVSGASVGLVRLDGVAS